MRFSMKHPFFVAMFAVVAAAAIVSGCSSTSSVPSTAASTATAAPTASSGSTAAFPCGTVSGNGTGTVTTFTTGTAVNFPALGSCSSSITFQSGTTFANGTSITTTSSLTAPSGAPSPLPTNPSGTNAPTTIEFVTLAVTAGSITIPAGANAAPVQTVTLANTGTCKTYYQGFAGGGAWQGGFGTAGTLSGSTVTFPTGTNSSSVTLTASNTYYIAYVCF